eukprot:comp47439_c0_seq1/m.47606 comp47439_c0_seq1/g.47606  ORF comp47439_c0_seq1/g.47606 comp47439_c0_seq1/m.47606 type:complete len:516 (-) comp47439_c0_seq1:114-1661(-)
MDTDLSYNGAEPGRWSDPGAGDVLYINQVLTNTGCPTILSLSNADEKLRNNVISVVSHLLRVHADHEGERDVWESGLVRAREKENDLHATVGRLRETIEASEQRCAQAEMKWQQCVAEVDRRKLENIRLKEEVNRLNSIIKNNETHYIHKLTRTEQDCQKLQEKLSKMLRSQIPKGGSGAPAIKVVGGPSLLKPKLGAARATAVDFDHSGYVESGQTSRCRKLEADALKLRSLVETVSAQIHTQIADFKDGDQDESFEGPVRPLSSLVFQQPLDRVHELVTAHVATCCNLIGQWARDSLERAQGMEEVQSCDHEDTISRLHQELERWQGIAEAHGGVLQAYIDGPPRPGEIGPNYRLTEEIEWIHRQKKDLERERTVLSLMHQNALTERQTAESLLQRVIREKAQLRADKLAWIRGGSNTEIQRERGGSNSEIQRERGGSNSEIQRERGGSNTEVENRIPVKAVVQYTPTKDRRRSVLADRQNIAGPRTPTAKKGLFFAPISSPDRLASPLPATP